MIGYRRVKAKHTRQHWMLFAVAMLLLAGCVEKGGPVPMPVVAASPSPASPSPNSDTEAVKHSYTEFIAILDKATSFSGGNLKNQLSVVMTDPQLSRVLTRMKELGTKNLTSYGGIVVHVRSVQVDDSEAILCDCQDSRNAGLMNSVTQEKVNRGVQEGNAEALLTKGSDGRWRVKKYIMIGEGC